VSHVRLTADNGKRERRRQPRAHWTRVAPKDRASLHKRERVVGGRNEHPLLNRLG